MKNIMNIGDRLEKYVYTNNISNDEWLKILNVIETYSGIKSIKKYSKDNDISPQGVYKHRKVYSFLNVKFVIDNF